MKLGLRRENEVEDLLYLAGMQNAFQAWEQQQVSRVRDSLAQHIPAPGQKDRRGIEWHILHSMTAQPNATWLGSHDAAVTELAVFPDGRRVASVGMDKTLRIWDSDTSECTAVMEMGDSSVEGLYSVAISPDGKTIATGSDAVQLWDVATGERKRLVAKYDANVDALAFSRDGKNLATSTRYDQVQLFSLDGTLLNSISDTSRHLTLDFTADGRHLLVPSRMKEDEKSRMRDTLRAWKADLSSVSIQHESALLAEHNILAIDCPALGGIWACREIGHGVGCLIDASNGRELLQLPGKNEGIHAIAASQDGGLFAVGFKSGVVRYWRVQRASENGDWKLSRMHSIDATEGAVTSVKFLTSNRIVTSDDDGKIKMWELPPATNPRFMHDFSLRNIACSNTEFRVALTSQRAIHVVDRDGTVLWKKESDSPYGDAAFSSDGQLLAVRMANGIIELLDAASASVLHRIDFVKAASPPLFSPQGRQFACVSNTGDLWIIDSEKCAEVAPISLDPGGIERRDYACDYSPDGRFLVCGGDIGEIVVVDVMLRRVVNRVSARGLTESLSFDRDGQFFASCHSGGLIRIWDWPTAKQLRLIKGPDETVRDIAVSADGKTLITCAPRAIRLWSVQHGREFGAICRESDSHVYCIECSSDKKRIYAARDAVGNIPLGLAIFSVDPK